MGWASGSILFTEIIRAAKRAVPSIHTRRAFYMKVLKAFEQNDWDTQDECEGLDPVFDKILTSRRKEESE